MAFASYTRNGSLHFLAVWRFRFTFCIAKDTVAQRDAKRDAAFVYRDYQQGGYIVTVKHYADGFAYLMPGRALYPGVNVAELPSVPDCVSHTPRDFAKGSL